MSPNRDVPGPEDEYKLDDAPHPMVWDGLPESRWSPTIWVVTISCDPDAKGTTAIHCLVQSEADAKMLVDELRKRADNPIRIDEQPATWECTGVDGCHVAA